MKFLITGGSGFVGRHLVSYLLNQQHDVTVLVHENTVVPAECTVVHALTDVALSEHFDVVINLAGTKIDRRWSESVKFDLFDSRLSVAQSLIELCAHFKTKPSLFIQASAIGYYGACGNAPMDESADPVTPSFTHELCNAVEHAAMVAGVYDMRVCFARFGVVLESDGGVVNKMRLPFLCGGGGILGDGSQMFSWIHMQDLIAAVMHLVNHADCEGAYNFCAPNPVTNTVFTKEFAKALHRFAIFPIPAFMVKLLFGQMGEELLLEGKNILPKRLLDEGFEFSYPELKAALQDIL